MPQQKPLRQAILPGFAALLIAVLVAACGAPGEGPAEQTSDVGEPTATAVSVATPMPVATTAPTATAHPEPTPTAVPEPTPEPTALPIPEPEVATLAELLPGANAELQELDVFELRISAILDEFGLWSTIQYTSQFDASRMGVAEVMRPLGGFERSAQSAAFRDDDVIVREGPILALEPEWRLPSPSEIDELRLMEPALNKDHIANLLAELAPLVVNESGGVFGVITRIDAEVSAVHVLEALPAWLRQDIELHLLELPEQGELVPVQVLFEEGEWSSLSLGLTSLISDVNTVFPAKQLDVRFEIVRRNPDLYWIDALSGQ